MFTHPVRHPSSLVPAIHPQTCRWSRRLTAPRPDHDVAVIGAGPSGSRTAQLLATRGLRVAIFERDAQPGQPVHCTGIVSTECFERYDLPASLVIREVRSFVLRAPSGRGTRVQRDATQAYVLDRVALDRLLADRAVQAGAELVLGTTVEDIRWDGKGVTLRMNNGGERQTATARAAVLATGYGAPLMARAGIEDEREVLSGCQAVVAADGVDDVEVFTGSVFGHGGYGWLVPWRPGYALAGLLTRKHTVRLMDEHLQRLRAQGRIGAVEQVYRCRPIPLGVPKSAVADGILAVGDVIGQVKPTSGGGIYYGLLGAEAAADVLADALERGDLTAAALAPYDQRWRALMETEIRQGYALRRVLEQLPDAVVENLHRVLSVPGLKRLISSTATFDWHSGPLTKLLARLQHHDTREPAAS